MICEFGTVTKFIFLNRFKHTHYSSAAGILVYLSAKQKQAEKESTHTDRWVFKVVKTVTALQSRKSFKLSMMKRVMNGI